MTTVWNSLFQVDAEHAIPVAEAWIALLAVLRDLPRLADAQGASL